MKTFRDFMESSLYKPGLGYYEHRVPMEDFYTAPELHPAFAGILAEEAVKRLESLRERKVPGPYLVAEMGSGSGALARGFCKVLRERHPDWASQITYVLVERSESQLLDSIRSFIGSGMKVLGYADLRDVPKFSGVFLSNELVDAFPVHVLEKRDGKMRELYVDGDQAGAVTEQLGDLSTLELKPVADIIAINMQEGDRHAVNLEARNWMGQVAQKLTAGAVITVDYGKRFSASDPNPPRTFFRHSTGNDVTQRPGQQDLTASVDFEALIREGEKQGLRLDSYTTLSRFLIDRGIMSWMPAPAEAEDWKNYGERNKIKTLIHPEGMGEVFKVLIQEKI